MRYGFWPELDHLSSTSCSRSSALLYSPSLPCAHIWLCTAVMEYCWMCAQKTAMCLSVIRASTGCLAAPVVSVGAGLRVDVDVGAGCQQVSHGQHIGHPGKRQHLALGLLQRGSHLQGRNTFSAFCRHWQLVRLAECQHVQRQSHMACCSAAALCRQC